MKNKNKQPTLDDILVAFKGKGGGPEAESILNDSNTDKKDNSVFIWSNKNDAAKIIERCRNSIKSFKYDGSGVSLEIDRKAFRGIHCAFRTVKTGIDKNIEQSDDEE